MTDLFLSLMKKSPFSVEDMGVFLDAASVFEDARTQQGELRALRSSKEHCCVPFLCTTLSSSNGSQLLLML